jgi:hypothetical protein
MVAQEVDGIKHILSATVIEIPPILAEHLFGGVGRQYRD